MRFNFFLSFLAIFPIVSSTPTHPGNNPPRHRKGCLTHSDQDYIVNQWLRLFDTGPAGIDAIPSVVTENFQVYDEGLLFGNVTGSDPYLKSRDEFIADRKMREATQQKGKFETVVAFSSCHEIALRYEFKGVSDGNRCNTGVLAPAGRPLRFKGNDFLYVKPGTLLIEKVYGATDYLNLLFQLQADFRNPSEFGVCPGTTPAPPVCP